MTYPSTAVRAVFVLLLVCLSGSAQTVLLVHDRSLLSEQERETSRLIRFLGLSEQTAEVERYSAAQSHSRQGQAHTISAVLIPASLLEKLNEQLRDIDTEAQHRTPVIIYDIDLSTNALDLARWSSGLITGCAKTEQASLPAETHLTGDAPFVGPMAGLTLPSIGRPTCALITGSQSDEHLILSSGSQSSLESRLYHATIAGREVFFIPRMTPGTYHSPAGSLNLTQAFSNFASYLVAFKYLAADYEWHLPAQYANFTIDDPWLVQPYGNLDYVALLQQMRVHRFHTTIGFVPWNYDRSEPTVVELFRQNPRFYSLCLHGNNHSHQEFGPYDSNPLPGQVQSVAEGLSRMDLLEQETGLRYSRFMVFPHGIAPNQTLIELRNEGFNGTANSVNVPSDRTLPEDPLFVLHVFTRDFASFLSLRRYSVEAPVDIREVAISAFFGDPLLFYAHQLFFSTGSTAFNGTADLVNRLEPATQWVDLGTLSRNLYQVRRRPDGNIDVQMLSSEMTLAATNESPVTFYVSMTIDPDMQIHGVSVNGKQVPATIADGALRFQIRGSKDLVQDVVVPISAQRSATPPTLSRSTIRSTVLRRLSDFRDMHLSRLALGRSLIRLYYNRDIDTWELGFERHFLGCLMMLSLLGLFPIVLKTILRRRNARRPQILDHTSI